MTERKMVAQLALSLEADFGEKTWLFRMGESMLVSAGMFYIVPQDEYEKMLRDAAGERDK
jgi:hypothetical protein